MTAPPTSPQSDYEIIASHSFLQRCSGSEDIIIERVQASQDMSSEYQCMPPALRRHSEFRKAVNCTEFEAQYAMH